MYVLGASGRVQNIAKPHGSVRGRTSRGVFARFSSFYRMNWPDVDVRLTAVLPFSIFTNRKRPEVDLRLGCGAAWEDIRREAYRLVSFFLRFS